MELGCCAGGDGSRFLRVPDPRFTWADFEHGKPRPATRNIQNGNREMARTAKRPGSRRISGPFYGAEEPRRAGGTWVIPISPVTSDYKVSLLDTSVFAGLDGSATNAIFRCRPMTSQPARARVLRAGLRRLLRKFSANFRGAVNTSLTPSGTFN